MVKVIAIEQFKDKVANVLRELGESFEVDEARFEVLSGNNDFGRAFVERAKLETSETIETVPEDKASNEAVDLSKLTKKELQAKLEEAGIEYDKKATNAQLVALLSATKD